MLRYFVDPTVSTAEQQRKAKWLQRLLGIFLVLALFATLLGLLHYGLSRQSLITVAALVLMAGLYAVNQRGWSNLAALGLVGILLVSIALLLNDSRTTLLPAIANSALFVIPIAVAGVFLSWRSVLATVLITIAGVWWYYTPGWSPLVFPPAVMADSTLTSLISTLAILFVATGALSWLSGRIIGETVNDLRRRNADLEAAYNDLTAQSAREHDLGRDITSLAAELTGVSARQLTGVSSQAHAISEVVSTVAELHAAAEQIAAVSHEVSKAAETALHSVGRAQELVAQSREAVSRNRSQVQVVIARMAELGDLTTGIAGFINEIRELSDETHLLALNATIEAAGAGTFGRRFSVVAAEVQTLSTRSNRIVDQIRDLIEGLQLAGDTVREATQNSVRVADEVEALADQVRQAQEQVVGAVNRTNELLHLIATATTQQTSATQQVTYTMQQIAQSAGSTSEDTTALDRAIHEMLHAAALLDTAMNRLRRAPAAEA
ncbi:MAG: methyl-accepting chemotaxis protein [Chloroflexota bacterium]|nr:methyl-accepting chemotaxis protein [Chloroflexota bacterium]